MAAARTVYMACKSCNFITEQTDDSGLHLFVLSNKPFGLTVTVIHGKPPFDQFLSDRTLTASYPSRETYYHNE